MLIKLQFNYKKTAVIILASVAIGIGYNFLSPNGIPFFREETAVVYENNDEQFVTENEDNNNEVRALTTEKVYGIFNKGGAKFVDARDNWDFAEGHIPGAVNIPEYKFTPDDPSLKSLNKDEKIIVYCEGNQCDVSKRLASELKKLGYKYIWVYIGGWEEWSEYKLPVEK